MAARLLQWCYANTWSIIWKHYVIHKTMCKEHLMKFGCLVLEIYMWIDKQTDMLSMIVPTFSYVGMLQCRTLLAVLCDEWRSVEIVWQLTQCCYDCSLYVWVYVCLYVCVFVVLMTALCMSMIVIAMKGHWGFVFMFEFQISLMSAAFRCPTNPALHWTHSLTVCLSVDETHWVRVFYKDLTRV